jgi:hypothetical protein
LIMDFCIYLLAAPGKYSAVGSHSDSIRVWNGEVIYILLYLLKTLSIHLANRYRLSSAYKYLLQYKYNFSNLYKIWGKKNYTFSSPTWGISHGVLIAYMLSYDSLRQKITFFFSYGISIFVWYWWFKFCKMLIYWY